MSVRSVSDEEIETKIANGKNTNQRSFSEKRILMVPRKTGKINVHLELDRLIEFVETLSYNDYKNFINRTSMAHARLARKVLIGVENLPTLSSTRHQMKMVLSQDDGMDSVEIAVAMGHKSQETQKKNYGINRRGSFVPSKNEVALGSLVYIDDSQKQYVLPSRRDKIKGITDKKITEKIIN